MIQDKFKAAHTSVSISALESMEKMVKQLQAERDMLLEAMSESRKALEHANELPNGPICDTIWMIEGPETLFDFMDSALARCTDSAKVME